MCVSKGDSIGPPFTEVRIRRPPKCAQEPSVYHGGSTALYAPWVQRTRSSSRSNASGSATSKNPMPWAWPKAKKSIPVLRYAA